MTEQSADTRYLLARLDNIIIAINSSRERAAELEAEAKAQAAALDTIQTVLMEIRDGLRPLLDSSAPRTFPYDKRGV